VRTPDISGLLNLFRAIVTTMKRPRAVTHRLQLIWNNKRLRRMRLQFLSEVTGRRREEVAQYISEVEADYRFIRAVRAAYRRWTCYIPLPTDFMVDKSGSTMFFHAVSLYAFVRLMRPEIIVETGCTPGKFSAFILRALDRNRFGHLWTIDLPLPEIEGTIAASSTTHFVRPAGAPPNWAVPEWLRGRQTLILAPAQEVLPKLLRELGSVSLFIHDSDHSYSHMRWELETAYAFLQLGGFIWCDDISTNTAWFDFLESKDLFHREFTSQGVARRDS